MKKFLLFFLCLFCFVFPLEVSASNYGISNYYIDATVQSNGDIKVKELFVLEGSFNGFERIIHFKNSYAPIFNGTVSGLSGSSLYNGSGITIDAVKAIKADENSSFDVLYSDGDNFKEYDYANKGDFGVYDVSYTSVGANILIYNPSDKGKHGFYVEYTLQGMGILHEDIAEIGWNLFSDELTESVEHLEARIHIPGNTTLLRGWAHGPLQGEITLVGTDRIDLTVDYLNAREAMDVRFAFDKSVLAETTKSSSLNVLDEIINIETKLADQANEEREQYYAELVKFATYYVEKAEKSKKRDDYEVALSWVNKLKDDEIKAGFEERLSVLLVEIEKREQFFKKMFLILSGVWFVGLILLLRYVYHRYDKEYSSGFKGKYYRDFPATYGPSTVGYLIHRSVRNDDLSASILNLICMKVIGFEKDELSKSKDSFKLIKLDHNLTLCAADQMLLDFLFGNYDSVTLYDLKKRARSRYQSFIDDFTSWKSMALIEAKNENFYESNPTVRIWAVLYCVVGVLIALYRTYFVLNCLMIVVAIIAFIYFISYTKKTQKGNDDYRKWIGLKNFMLDFGRMDTKDLPEIVLWEKYLAYAVTLGCADKLAKTMKIKVQEMNQAGYTVSDSLFDFYYFDSMIRFNRVMNQSINSAISSAYSERSQAMAASSSSSGGGFGGGFSGGGGSFGGGGGGGRF